MIRFFPNQRQVQATINLENNRNSKWFLPKTVQLAHPQQTDVRIDLVIPIVACNLMMEYVDFFKTSSRSTTFKCPRCNSAVTASPGIYLYCDENDFQCLSLNTDERDPFFHNSCGYCKPCQLDSVFTCQQTNSNQIRSLHKWTIKNQLSNSFWINSIQKSRHLFPFQKTLTQYRRTYATPSHLSLNPQWSLEEWIDWFNRLTMNSPNQWKLISVAARQKTS